MKNERLLSKTEIVIYLFPLLISLFFILQKSLFPTAYHSAVQEDSFIEYSQAFLYFSASILSILIVVVYVKKRSRIRALLYCFLSSGLLFVSFEEISWGQRILEIETPRYFELNNTQGELSLHNLQPIQSKLIEAYILVGIFGSFAWIAARMPLTKPFRILEVIVPDWFTSSYFYPVLFIYSLFKYIAQPHEGSFLMWGDQEPAELILSMGFLAFVLSNLQKARAFQRESTEV